MGNLEDEFGTRPASQEAFDAWNADNIRGIRSVPSGVRVDSRGNRINEYKVIDDEFGIGTSGQTTQHAPGCICAACRERDFKYINRHQKLHRHVPDPACVICQKEQEFRKQHPELVGKRVGVQS